MVCSMCEVSGFISGGPIRVEESAEIANAAFLHIFIPNGLPRLVFLDSGPAMKRSLHALCRQLQIPVHTVSPSNHRAVRVERFFCYLNKVVKITAADTQSHMEWLAGVIFAMYGWNSMPVAGTDLIRSFVAKGR
eukprot:scaffold192647_cov30-Attheya_sp.AAC.1